MKTGPSARQRVSAAEFSVKSNLFDSTNNPVGSGVPRFNYFQNAVSCVRSIVDVSEFVETALTATTSKSKIGSISFKFSAPSERLC